MRTHLLAVLKREASNQTLRKVKGHATMEDVEAGRSTREDMIGNDKADKNADKGVEAIQGPGLVELAKWTAKRHKANRCFIMRVQRFIVAIITVEKDEKGKE